MEVYEWVWLACMVFYFILVAWLVIYWVATLTEEVNKSESVSVIREYSPSYETAFSVHNVMKLQVLQLYYHHIVIYIFVRKVGYMDEESAHVLAPLVDASTLRIEGIYLYPIYYVFIWLFRHHWP